MRYSHLAIGVSLLAAALLGRLNYVSKAHNIDYFTFWSVSHALGAAPFAGQPIPDIYSPDVQRAMGRVMIDEAQRGYVSQEQAKATAITSQLYDGRVDATGTPFAYALVALTSTGRFSIDLQAFQIACALCLIAGIVLMARVARFDPPLMLVAAAFFLAAFAPVVADVLAANLNQIQLLFLALYIWAYADKRYVLAGAALGAAIAFKPNLAIIALVGAIVCLVDRQFRRLQRFVTGLFAATLVAFAIGTAYFGRMSIWLDFAASVPKTLGRGYPLSNGNYGLAELIMATTGLHIVDAVVGLLFLGFIAALVQTRLSVAATEGRAHSPADGFLIAGAGGALLVLGSRLAWLHYYIVLIPIALYLLQPKFLTDVSARYRRIAWTCAAVSLLMLSEPVIEIGNPVHEALMFNAAVILLFAACVYTMWSMRREQRQQATAEGPARRKTAKR